MTTVGADSDQLDQLARRFVLAGDQLELAARTVGELANSAGWQGPDGEQLRADVASVHLPRLGLAATFVRSLGDVLHQQAEQQRDASTANGGGAGGAGSPLPLSSRPDPGGGGDDGTGPELNLDHGTPQGQGYDEGRDELLTTYYDDDGVTLSIQDRLGGTDETSVTLGGGDGYGPPDKGGGVATDGDYVYVADGGELYVYSRSEIDAAAAAGRPAVPDYVKGDIAAGSYVDVNDGQLYVGDFKNPPDGPFADYQGEPHLYQYDVGPDGVVADDYNYKVRTPYHVQDVAITDDGLLYSRSYSNKDHSPNYLTLQSGDASTGQVDAWQDSRNVQEIPYYSEGISVVDGEVYVTHESGALNPNGDSSDTHVQRHSLDDLSPIDGPLDREPEPWWKRIL